MLSNNAKARIRVPLTCRRRAVFCGREEYAVYLAYGQAGNERAEEALCPDVLTFVRGVWLPTVRGARHSWQVDERISRQHILPYFGAMRFSELTPEVAKAWLANFSERRFAVSTRNRILCVFKDIIRLAVAKNYLAAEDSPLQNLHCAPENRRVAAALDAASLENLLRRLGSSDRPEAKALSLLIFTGADKMEILSARWEHFRPREKRLSVFSQSGKKRVLDLSGEALALLNSLPRAHGSPWLFPGKNKKRPLSQLFPFWKRTREECGLGHVRIKDLSHVRAGAAARVSRLDESGVSRANSASPSPLPGASGREKAAPIAIIGMAMRFPGNVRDEESMWETLIGRKCRVTKIPDNRWPAEELSHPNRAEPGRSVTFAAGVLEDVDKFDAAFFKISPREAAWMDPQQRILLEMARDAMADAGVSPDALAGGDCGVYVGVSGMDYGQHALADLASMSPHTMTGNTLSITANRLSYFYDLRGPSVAIDTACSSALTAVHHACQALRSGEISVALAGGVNLLMHPYSFIGFSHASMLSANGRCRPFDAGADGYARGEGGALLLLKPYDRALADGDPIHAVILATGVNSDGSRKTGLTIPSAEAQVELMRSSLRAAGLEARDVDFVEAHGTGTPAGDPAEARSIGLAYGEGRDAPVPISSGKANFGHLEPASGMVGLIKAVLTLKRGVVPPTPFDFTPNPRIDFAGLNITCAASPIELASGKTLVGAVNSFGFGGLNAHALLCAPAVAPERKSAERRTPPPLFLSANSDASLRALAKIYAERISAGENWYDAAYNAAFNTSALDKRVAVWPRDKKGGLRALEDFAAGVSNRVVSVETALAEPGGVAFVYSGNGSQWLGMGRRLLEESREFARLVTELDARMRPTLGYSILEKLVGGEAAEMEDAAISQPLLFAMQVALTRYFAGMGIRPDAVTGHSVGEVAAAWASGALTLDEAIGVIHARSASQSKTRGAGVMAAAALSAAETAKIIAALGLEDKLEIAAINSPTNVTISGDADAMNVFKEHARERGVFFRELGLDYAFHSRHMEAARESLRILSPGLSPGPAKDALFVSAVAGAVYSGEKLDGDYWWRNMRETVDFAGAIGALAGTGARIFVEIGPHAVLQRYIRENLQNIGVNARVTPTLQRNADGDERARAVAASLHLLTSLKGAKKLFPVKGKRLRLPAYPWDRKSHWFPRTSEMDAVRKRKFPALGWPLAAADPVWENILDPRKDAWLADHVVGGAAVFPAAGYAELALEAARASLNSEALVIEDFDIFLPLTFADNAAQTVRCALNPADGVFRVLSRPRLDEGGWTERARCRLLARKSLAGAKGKLDGDGLNSAMSGEELYATAARVGLDYGSTYRRVVEARYGANAVEAILKEAPSGDWVLDPGVLDACFHSIIALFSVDENAFAWLPAGFKRLELLSSEPAVKVRAKVDKKSSRVLRANFEILSATGELVARIIDCRFRALPAVNSAKIPQWLPLARLAPTLENDAWIPSVKDVLSEAKAAPESPDHFLWYREILPRLEAATLAGLARNCALALREGREPAPGAYGRWMRDVLAAQDLRDGEGWEALPDWLEIWREAYVLAPRFLPALLPAARVLARLGELAREEIEPARLAAEIRENAIADENNWPGPADAGVALAAEAAVRLLARKLPSGDVLRVLVLGAPFENLAEAMATLPADRVRATIVAPGARLARGENREIINANPLEWLEKEAASGEKFDLVIVRHALRDAKNLREATLKIRELLNPGGLFELVESRPDWSAELVSGLDPEWWRETENGEILSSRLSPRAWVELLRENGFAEAEEYVENAAGDLAEGSFLICAKKPYEAPAPIRLNAKMAFFAADSAYASEAMIASLAVGADAREFDAMPPGWTPEYAVIFVDGASSVDFASAILDKLNKFVERVATFEPLPGLILVTRGGSLAEGRNPAQGAITGFWRVVANEYPGLKLAAVDFSDETSPEAAARTLLAELANPAFGEEITYSGDGRRTLRLEPLGAEKTRKAERIILRAAQSGRLDSLVWAEASAPAELPPDWIESRVMAVGLNFRDVMLGMGLLPEDALENGFAGPTFGLEYAGVITRVGANVRDFAPGDRVAGFASSCFASHVTAPARATAKIPDDISFELAAATPTILVTAWYALKRLANLRPGEKVLIHGGAGGVGLIAVWIAKNVGAEIYATAGTPEKRDFLRALGVTRVFDSRDLDFYEQILAEGGVDVVLNSLAGEAMRRSVALLRPFGRFLELGKRDYVENTSLGLRPFKENVSYFGVDVDQLLSARPELATEVFAEAMAALEKGEVVPPPYRVFPADRVVEAFRVMQKSRHIGKIVVSLRALPPVAVSAGEKPDYSGSWLISGGTSGFGLETARHLARRGATRLVLASRRGGDVPDAAKIGEELGALGAEVVFEKCDFGDREAVKSLVNRVSADSLLKGVVHAAAVFDDKLLKNMGERDWEISLKPKLEGAWNLHEATLARPPRYFVVFSSISVALGNPGQGNYVAANAGLESLMEARSRAGASALAIAWGPIGDAGYLTRTEKVGKALAARLGGELLSSAEATREFDRLLGENGVRVVARVDWPAVLNAWENAPARFADLRDATAGAGARGTDLKELLRTLSPEEVEDAVRRCVLDESSRVLGLDAAQIPPDRSLQSLGMDSLMAMELGLAIERRTGFALPPMLMQDAPAVEELARRITRRALGEKESERGDELLATLANAHSETLKPEEIRDVMAEMEAIRK